MKYIKTKTVFFTVAILALSCAAFAQGPNKLSTAQWRLTQINGTRVTNSKAMIEININRTRFTGNTGCNRMFGSVSVNGRQIGDTLELYRRNQLVMKFTAIAKEYTDSGDSSRIRLEDRKWMIEQIGTRVNIKALPEAFVVFDEKKHSAGGNSSCNVFGGSYTTTGDRLRITNVISTMRACIEDELMQVERGFLDGLRNANRFAIRDNRLMLYRGNEILLTLRGLEK